MTPLRWRRVPSLIGLLLIQGVTLVLLLTSHASPVRAAFAEPDGSYDVVVVEHLLVQTHKFNLTTQVHLVHLLTSRSMALVFLQAM